MDTVYFRIVKNQKMSTKEKSGEVNYMYLLIESNTTQPYDIF